MSKFCGNCGATLDDAAVVCGYCGAPLNAGGPAKDKGINKAGVASVAKELMGNKIVKIAVPVVIAVVAILLVVFLAIVPNTGYRGEVKKFMKAYESLDSDELIAYASMLETNGEDDNTMDNLQEDIDAHFEHIEDKCGSDLKLKYEIKSCEELSKSKLSDLKDEFDAKEDSYGIDSSSVEEARTLKLRITYKGDKREKTNNVTLTMIKEDGQWKFYAKEYNTHCFSN